jgi:hypothetical protein
MDDKTKPAEFIWRGPADGPPPWLCTPAFNAARAASRGDTKASHGDTDDAPEPAPPQPIDLRPTRGDQKGGSAG